MRKPEPFQGRKHLVLVHAGIRMGVPLRDLEQLLALAGHPFAVVILNAVPSRGQRRVEQVRTAVARFGLPVCPFTVAGLGARRRPRGARPSRSRPQNLRATTPPQPTGGTRDGWTRKRTRPESAGRIQGPTGAASEQPTHGAPCIRPLPAELHRAGPGARGDNRPARLSRSTAPSTRWPPALAATNVRACFRTDGPGPPISRRARTSAEHKSTKI